MVASGELEEIKKSVADGLDDADVEPDEIEDVEEDVPADEFEDGGAEV